MYTDGKEIFRQSKQKFRRQSIYLSRIFVMNDGKQIEPDLYSDFLKVPIIITGITAVKDIPEDKGKGCQKPEVLYSLHAPVLFRNTIDFTCS